MLKRYTWLVSILLIALLGIIILQAYFAYHDFQLKTYEFQEEVNLSFEKAVESEKRARIDSFIVYARSLFADTSKVKILAKYHEKDMSTHFSVKDKGTDELHTSLSFKDDKRQLNHLDSTNFEITLDKFMKSIRANIEIGSIYYWTPDLGEKMISYVDSSLYDEKQLGVFFQKNLSKKRISTHFHIQRFYTDSLSLNELPDRDFQSEVFSSEFPGKESVKVVAIIEDPFSEILGRIKMTLLGSGFLILLTAFSFFIMLRVIFRQKKLSQIKDDFIDNITHELQTPIATLMAANEGMEKYDVLKDSEKSKRYLAISKMELHRLSRMVDNILMSSIHNRASMSLEWEMVDVQDIIKQCIVKNELTSDQCVRFELDLQEEAIEIHTDKLHLQNILDNLIENALKYNDAEIKIIKISSGLQNGQLQITVIDNGNGIPHEQQDLVFEKFYRIPTDVGRVKGFGIGLYYIKTILQQLKGQISIQSASRRGTSFILSLPLDAHEI